MVKVPRSSQKYLLFVLEIVMAISRKDKLAEQIKKDLSEICNKHRLDFFNNEFLTITEVIVTADLGLAKVFISPLKAETKNSIMEAFEINHFQIKKMLASKLKNQLRKMPELRFVYDDSFERAQRLDEVFKKIKKDTSETE